MDTKERTFALCACLYKAIDLWPVSWVLDLGGSVLGILHMHTQKKANNPPLALESVP